MWIVSKDKGDLSSSQRRYKAVSLRSSLAGRTDARSAVVRVCWLRVTKIDTDRVPSRYLAHRVSSALAHSAVDWVRLHGRRERRLRDDSEWN